MGGKKEEKKVRLDWAGDLVGYDVVQAREWALEHARNDLRHRHAFLREIPSDIALIWEITSSRSIEQEDCYEVLVACYPDGGEVEQKAEWLYHVTFDGKPAPGTPVLKARLKWQPPETRELPTDESAPRKKAYHEFFSMLLKEFKSEAPHITSREKVGYAQSYFTLPDVRAGFHYAFSFAQEKRFRVGLYIDTGDRELNKKAFDLLAEHRERIAEEVSQHIEWERLDTKRACRVAVYRADSRITDPPEALTQLRKWAVQTMILFHKAMTPRIQQLRLEGS